MTNILLLLFSTLGFSNPTKADTIDYWHVYYNNNKIKEYNLYSNGEIVIKIKEVQKTDSITVLYFRDTPCSDCSNQVTVINEQYFTVSIGKGKGTWNPIKISVFDLIQKAEKGILNALYQEGAITNETESILLFKIKLE